MPCPVFWLDYTPQVQLRAGTAARVDRKVILLTELFKKTEDMSLTSVGPLELLQQVDHCIMDQAQHVSAGHAVTRQRSQPSECSSLLHPINHCFPGHWMKSGEKYTNVNE